MTFITVSIPTYNRAVKLDSLLSQFYDEIKFHNLNQDFSFYISNNGSTDHTDSVILKYQQLFKQSDINFEFYSQPLNLGMDTNFLCCLHKPKTKYIWLVSDDDILLKGLIKTHKLFKNV